MNTQFFRNMMMVCGAAALIMTSAIMPTTAFARGSASDQQIAEDVQQTLDHYVNSVAVKVENGHVYLRGQFDTREDQADAMNHINDINGVKGVYDYTEDLSGSNG